MFVRRLDDVSNSEFFVEWGAGTSHRMVRESDGVGFTVCHTVVLAGREARLQYRNHLEACYCVSGAGQVEDMGGKVYHIYPGDVYVLDNNDEHILRAGDGADLILVSVFNPPLKGTEVHRLDDEKASSY
ncbi:ectoine synthase [Phytopseudomonas flavescens]|uniref:ectoine synthase n=1 Tax=Phytopseudomonas flavescens TaxID=29435 RepID=UPI000A00D48D|nr:ectoine synthase [Pseudomonas flavescens]